MSFKYSGSEYLIEPSAFEDDIVEQTIDFDSPKSPSLILSE